MEKLYELHLKKNIRRSVEWRQVFQNWLQQKSNIIELENTTVFVSCLSKISKLQYQIQIKLVIIMRHHYFINIRGYNQFFINMLIKIFF